MKKSYTIKKFDSESEIDFSKVPALNIHNCLWDKTGYAPVSMGQICYTEKGLFIKLTSFETEITGRYENLNEPVYTDSCLEFFLNPSPETDKRYMNFETNCLGTLLLGIGENGKERTEVDVDFRKMFKMASSVMKDTIGAYTGNHWWVSYHIPFDFLENIFGSLSIMPGKKIAANMFKCGDETKFEHYMSWNKVEGDTPNFHQSQYFGEMILGE